MSRWENETIFPWPIVWVKGVKSYCNPPLSNCHQRWSDVFWSTLYNKGIFSIWRHYVWRKSAVTVFCSKYRSELTRTLYLVLALVLTSLELADRAGTSTRKTSRTWCRCTVPAGKVRRRRRNFFSATEHRSPRPTRHSRLLFTGPSSLDTSRRYWRYSRSGLIFISAFDLVWSLHCVLSTEYPSHDCTDPVSTSDQKIGSIPIDVTDLPGWERRMAGASIPQKPWRNLPLPFLPPPSPSPFPSFPPFSSPLLSFPSLRSRTP